MRFDDGSSKESLAAVLGSLPFGYFLCVMHSKAGCPRSKKIASTGVEMGLSFFFLFFFSNPCSVGT